MHDRTNSATMNTHAQATDPTSMHQPLAKFTVFPKLPPELRQKIFKDALPSGSRGYRMLWVYGIVIVSDRCKNSSTKKYKSKLKPSSKAYIEFTLQRSSDSHTAKDLALSRSCTESRAVFLKRNPYTLITKGGGFIRFAKDDIIYLSKPRTRSQSQSLGTFSTNALSLKPITNSYPTPSDCALISQHSSPRNSLYQSRPFLTSARYVEHMLDQSSKREARSLPAWT